MNAFSLQFSFSAGSNQARYLLAWPFGLLSASTWSALSRTLGKKTMHPG
jgi:hypothetical protein